MVRRFLYGTLAAMALTVLLGGAVLVESGAFDAGRTAANDNTDQVAWGWGRYSGYGYPYYGGYGGYRGYGGYGGYYRGYGYGNSYSPYYGYSGYGSGYGYSPYYGGYSWW